MTMSKPKILIVDDEERNLRLVEGLLNPLGYEIFLARDGEEGLAVGRRVQPDLILLDIMMPKMNGFEVARKLKEDPITKIIPIVMVTALRDVEDRVRALEAGADDFLSKPIEKVEMRARVKSLLKVKAYNDSLQGYQKKLEAEVEKKTEQISKGLERLKLASLETVLRLSRAAEFKDEETANHIRRVSQYAMLLARKDGLGEEAVEKIQYAAPMHDIGKIGIPESILLKPGELTPEEWKIMKQHPDIGVKILEGSQTDFIILAEVIALTHHERWNGSGYPNGLKGEEIPLEGRIVAIADVFDALTSKRPYRKEMSFQKAFQFIASQRGTLFDPGLVDLFCSLEPEIRAIRTEHEDESESFLVMISQGDPGTSKKAGPGELSKRE